MEALHNDEQRQVLMRFFKTGPGEYGEGDEFLGLKVPQTREVVRAIAKDFPLGEVPELLLSKWHEVRLGGLLILVSKFERLSTKRQIRDEEAIRGRDEILTMYLQYAGQANNWDFVDLSAPKILGGWLTVPLLSSREGEDCSCLSHVSPKEERAIKQRVLDGLAAAHEHRLHVEDHTAGRSVVVSALCRDAPPSYARPNAQGRRLDVARNG